MQPEHLVSWKGTSRLKHTAIRTVAYENKIIRKIRNWYNQIQTWSALKLNNRQLYGAASLISSHLSPLALKVVGAPHMTLQQYISTFPCLPLSSGNLQTPD